MIVALINEGIVIEAIFWYLSFNLNLLFKINYFNFYLLVCWDLMDINKENLLGKTRIILEC